MTHGESVGELCAGTLQRRQSRRQRLSRRPSLIALTLECQQLTVGKFRGRRFHSGIAADLQRRRELLEIARNGIALKRERRRVMDIAHQQIDGGTQSWSDEIT